VDAATRSFLQGDVLVSYGLIAELIVNGKHRSGELVTMTGDSVQVDVRVLGPHWNHASEVRLYGDGSLIREQQLSGEPNGELPAGVQWKGQWTLPRPKHDMHLVAIAIGKGIDRPYWKTAKAYQPVSPDWEAHTIGCSGAVWLDGDGDGRRTAAWGYADRLCAASAGDPEKLLSSLAAYDEATAVQAAHLLRLGGEPLQAGRLAAALRSAAPHVQAGFRTYAEAWQANEVARSQP
jgi:hypothetical protein